MLVRMPTGDPIEQLRHALPGLRARFGVVSLGLFGSLARGDQGPESDADVLVGFAPDALVTLLTLARLKEELEAVLGRPVDLVEDHARLRAAFRAGIERDLVRVA